MAPAVFPRFLVLGPKDRAALAGGRCIDVILGSIHALPMPSEKKNIRIEAFFDDTVAVEEAFSPSAAGILEDVHIDSGITVKPLFVAVRTSRIVGGHEALAFLLTVTSSIAAKALAEAIYKWFKQTNATRLKIEKTEVLITRPDEVIRVIHEVIDKEIS